LFLSIGVIYIFYLMEIRRKLIWDGLSDAIKTLGGWFIILIAAYTVFWPGMWVAPGRMLYDVYGNAFSYAFKGAQLQLTQNLQPSIGSLNSSVGDMADDAFFMVWVCVWDWGLIHPNQGRNKKTAEMAYCLSAVDSKPVYPGVWHCKGT
jgi:hypothetical protein